MVPVDLTTMVPSAVRIRMKLAASEYLVVASRGAKVCSFEVTPVLEGTDSDYVITAICGKITMHCLTTGVELKAFRAVLQRIQYVPITDAAVSLVAVPGGNRFTIAIWSASSTHVTLLHINDFNLRDAMVMVSESLPSETKHRLQYKRAQGLVHRDEPEDGSEKFAGRIAVRERQTQRRPKFWQTAKLQIFAGRLRNGQDMRTVESWIQSLLLRIIEKV